ncbi:MAG: DHA2 family efflux MFS transporter permease subunit [Verrucomicrobia bacterium]|nr:DHA2 family efflux MFS transporter permease subunit [Verrucomicrobiota bacterium]
MAAASMSSALDQGQKPAVNPWFIAFAVMLATFMEVLDTSVANVALNHIAGNLSASTDEATWVLTSYLVSNAIVLPATGWLGRFFGRKRFLITCIVIFTVSSALCGLASSLGMLIVARVVQGAGGGALQPIAQAVLLESFPREKRGSAMSVYAIGVVVAPILGPTIGGWLTDSYSWRWVFFINIPIGILAVILCSILLEDPAYLKNARPGRIDFVGFGLLALWIGCLQVMLDKGQDADWLYSNLIRTLAVGAVLGFCVFVVWELRVEHPIVNLRILGDRNLAIGSLLLFLIGAILYGTTAVLPLFLQNLVSYTSFNAGLVMSPRGFGAILGSIISGRILSNPKIDGRAWIGGGFAILALSMYMLGNLTTEIAPANIIWPIIISGFSVTCIFVPMTTYSMATVSHENMGEATGLTNLLRNLGGSVGISAITTMVSRGTQTHQGLLVGHLSQYNPVFNEHIANLQAALASQIGTVAAHNQAYALTYQRLLQQSALGAYVDQFRLLVIVCLLCGPLVFLFKKPARRPGSTELAAAH